jgi:glutamyl-Q tRNA(Asp) synthetase
MYVGRFAPSPTGPLHFGSFVAALASWLDARAASGRWLVRIEDLDTPRQQPGAADAILRTLERLGLHWDGTVIFQSRRGALYQRALDALRNQTFWCGCSRREIADSSPAPAPDGAQVYPGTCRAGVPPGKPRRALRVRAPNERIAFHDRVQGAQSQNVAERVGDFVLYRADGIFAYQLAVVVDDADQQISDIVRGADLLESTARQIFLQQLLRYARPRYLHVPVAATAAGEKLSKQSGAQPIDISKPEALLRRALGFLGQAPNDNLLDAIRDWNASRIPALHSAIVLDERGRRL